MTATAQNATDLSKVDGILAQYPRDRRALVMILQDVQKEFHYLPRGAIERVSSSLGVPLSHVFHLATFYRAFSIEPRGRHICTVCLGTACHVRGAGRLVEHIERKAGIKAGETTRDMEMTLETVNCVGACALGPVVIVDGEYVGAATATKVDKSLSKILKKRAGEEAES